jgi:hypothetical protein
MAKPTLTRRNPSARKMFLAAESFNTAGIWLTYLHAAKQKLSTGKASVMNGPRENVYQFLPVAVLYAFSLELYLKCLIRVGGGTISRRNGHNLWKLFKAIESTTRRDLTERYIRLAATDRINAELLRRNPKTDLSIKGVLVHSAKAFEKLRYPYDYRLTHKTGFSANLVTYAARQIIVDKHPAWVKWARRALSNFEPTYVPHPPTGLPAQSFAIRLDESQ